MRLKEKSDDFYDHNISYLTQFSLKKRCGSVFVSFFDYGTKQG